jgi:hypothetical protein
MATYTFYNTKTEEYSDISMAMSELDTFKENNKHLNQIPSMTAIADPTRLGLRKPDAGFRDVLKRVKKASGRGNKINTW